MVTSGGPGKCEERGTWGSEPVMMTSGERVGSGMFTSVIWIMSGGGVDGTIFGVVWIEMGW